MKRFSVLFVLFLILSTPLFAGDVNQQNYEEIKRHVLPSDQETEFLDINWRSTFWNAVVDAQKTDRPILLWAMNGHPLGRT